LCLPGVTLNLLSMFDVNFWCSLLSQKSLKMITLTQMLTLILSPIPYTIMFAWIVVFGCSPYCRRDIFSLAFARHWLQLNSACIGCVHASCQSVWSPAHTVTRWKLDCPHFYSSLILMSCYMNSRRVIDKCCITVLQLMLFKTTVAWRLSYKVSIVINFVLWLCRILVWALVLIWYWTQWCGQGVKL